MQTRFNPSQARLERIASGYRKAIGDPYATVDARYFRQMEDDDAREALESERLEQYAQEFWKEGDLYHAIALIPDAGEKVNKAWSEMERGSLVSASRTFREIMELAAYQRAQDRVDAEWEEMAKGRGEE